MKWLDHLAGGECKTIAVDSVSDAYINVHDEIMTDLINNHGMDRDQASKTAMEAMRRHVCPACLAGNHEDPVYPGIFKCECACHRGSK